MQLAADLGVALGLTLFHATVLICQFMIFSVAMNSKRSNAIIALLIASNFVEIKGAAAPRSPGPHTSHALGGSAMRTEILLCGQCQPTQDICTRDSNKTFPHRTLSPGELTSLQCPCRAPLPLQAIFSACACPSSVVVVF